LSKLLRYFNQILFRYL